MFQDASKFDQDLSCWQLDAAANTASSNMFDSSPMASNPPCWYKNDKVVDGGCTLATCEGATTSSTSTSTSTSSSTSTSTSSSTSTSTSSSTTTATTTTTTATATTTTTLIMPGLDCALDSQCTSGACRTHCCDAGQHTGTDQCLFCGNVDGSCYAPLALPTGWNPTTALADGWERTYNKDARTELDGPPLNFTSTTLVNRKGTVDQIRPGASATLTAAPPRQAVAVNDTYMTDEPAAAGAGNDDSAEDAADDEYLSVAAGVAHGAAQNDWEEDSDGGIDL
eukprot:gene4815-12769_t